MAESPNLLHKKVDYQTSIRNKLTTLEDAIVEQLASMILSNEIKPGEALNQYSLSKTFGVSRIPIRSALKSLEAQGLVTIQPRVGAQVIVFDEDQYKEIYQIRDRIEPWLAGRASLVADENIHRKLARLLAEMEEVCERGLLGHWVELDRDFHITIYTPVMRDTMEKIIRTLWNSSQFIRRRYISLSGTIDIALNSHKNLYEAYSRRNPEDVMKIESDHIRETIYKLFGEDSIEFIT